MRVIQDIIKALQSRYGIAGVIFLQPLECKAHSKQKKMHQQYVLYRYYFSVTIDFIGSDSDKMATKQIKKVSTKLTLLFFIRELFCTQNRYYFS